MRTAIGFYEDDEDPEDVRRAFELEVHGVTDRPATYGNTVTFSSNMIPSTTTYASWGVLRTTQRS